MNQYVRDLIRKYAATYVDIGPGAGRGMRRIAEREWKAANEEQRRVFMSSWRRRVREWSEAQKRMRS